MRKLLIWTRRWHGNLAIVFIFPILIMASTAILIAHGKALGIRNIFIDASWLPGYQTNTANSQQNIRSIVEKENGWWLLSSAGLFDITNNQATLVTPLADKDIRSLIATTDGVLAVSDKGLWREQHGKWLQIFKGNILQASGNEHSIVVMLRGKGSMQSHDHGATWTSLNPVMSSLLTQNPALSQQSNKISLAQLIRDIHKGVALVGEKAQWIWIDSIALLLIFLAVTGMIMWWNKQKSRPKITT
jgi:hypothetical protein